MIGLRAAAEDYLAMRRALGFKLTTQARQLRSFVDYCENHDSDRITSDLALAWATHTPHDSSHDAYLARRLMVVRIFARHLKTLDPATEIPPEDALPHHKCRIVPYLYGPGEIVALIAAAATNGAPIRRNRVFSSPPAAPAWTCITSGAPSPGCSTPRRSPHRRDSGGPDCMTCGTASPLPP